MINFFKIAMHLKGFPIKKAQLEFKKINDLNVEEFNRTINSKKWEQFNFFAANNNFYKSFIDSKRIENWEDIPVLTKKDIQIPFEEVLSDGYNLKNVFKNNTSGSSGTPFFFAKDKLSHAMTWALAINRYSRHGINYGQSLQARFYGIPLNGIKYYKEKLKDLLSARVRFPIFDLTDHTLDNFVKKFKEKRFEYINGYTSSLVFFANYLIKNKLVLKSICPTLKITFPTSEMCTELDRKTLEKGFGIPVANEYGCAEMDILACEDEHFDWILSNENVYIEILDDNNKELPPGSNGKIVITSLYNKAMPFIRYELGDMGTILQTKKGNHQILKELTGRTNEFALLKNGKRIPALTFYYITKTLIQEKYKIKEFVIKQLTFEHFHFEYVSDNELPEEAINKISKSMDEYLESGLTSTFEKKDKIERTKAGKQKQFSNLIKN